MHRAAALLDDSGPGHVNGSSTGSAAGGPRRLRGTWPPGAAPYDPARAGRLPALRSPGGAVGHGGGGGGQAAEPGKVSRTSSRRSRRTDAGCRKPCGRATAGPRLPPRACAPGGTVTAGCGAGSGGAGNGRRDGGTCAPQWRSPPWGRARAGAGAGRTAAPGPPQGAASCGGRPCGHAQRRRPRWITLTWTCWSLISYITRWTPTWMRSTSVLPNAPSGRGRRRGDRRR